jgi:hypothetical protein
LDDFGDRLAKGVYIYRLKISNSENLSAEKTEKLVILRYHAIKTSLFRIVTIQFII